MGVGAAGVHSLFQRGDKGKLISMYNEASFENPRILRFTLDGMTADELPAACLACGECVALCPQGIEIPEIMASLLKSSQTSPRWGPPPLPA